MSEEKLKQEETPAEVTEETVDQPSAEQPAEETSKESTDAYYEKQIEELQSELSKERETKENLLKAVKKERAESKESREPEEPAQAAIDEDRIAELVAKATTDKYNEMRVDMATTLFEEELEKISVNEKEKQLIKLRYQKSVKPSGFDRASIRRDLLLAKAAANIDRVKLTTETGDVSLTTAMSGGGGKVSDAVSTARVELSSDETKLLKKFGVDPKEAAKKLAS